MSSQVRTLKWKSLFLFVFSSFFFVLFCLFAVPEKLKQNDKKANKNDKNKNIEFQIHNKCGRRGKNELQVLSETLELCYRAGAEGPTALG